MKAIKFSEKYFKKHYFSLFDKTLLQDFKHLYKSDLNLFVNSNKEFVNNNLNLLKSYNLGAFNTDSNKIKFYKEITKSPLLVKLANLNEMKCYHIINELIESLSFKEISEFDGVVIVTKIYKAISLFHIKDDVHLALELIFEALIKSTVTENRYLQVLCLIYLCSFYRESGNEKFSHELASYTYKAYFEYNLNCEFLIQEIIGLCVETDEKSLKFLNEFNSKYIEPLKNELPIKYFLNKNYLYSNFDKEEYFKIYQEYRKKCLLKTDIDMNKSNSELVNQTFLNKHISEIDFISTIYNSRGRLVQNIKSVEENINNLNHSLNLRILINAYYDNFNSDFISNRFNLESNFAKNDILPKFKQSYKLLNDYANRNLNKFKNQNVKLIKEHDCLFSGYYENKLKMLNTYYFINTLKGIIKSEDKDIYFNEYVDSKISAHSFLNLQHLIIKLQIYINTEEINKALTTLLKIKGMQDEISKFPKLEYLVSNLEVKLYVLQTSSKNNLKKQSQSSNSGSNIQADFSLEKTVDAYNRFLILDDKIFGTSFSQDKYNLNLILKKNKLNSIIKNI